MDPFIEQAKRRYGAIEHSLPTYWLGAICWGIVMLWPLRWLDRIPHAIIARSGDYAHDARQYAIGLRRESR